MMKKNFMPEKAKTGEVAYLEEVQRQSLAEKRTIEEISKQREEKFTFTTN